MKLGLFRTALDISTAFLQNVLLYNAENISIQLITSNEYWALKNYLIIWHKRLWLWIWLQKLLKWNALKQAVKDLKLNLFSIRLRPKTSSKNQDPSFIAYQYWSIKFQFDIVGSVMFISRAKEYLSTSVCSV